MPSEMISKRMYLIRAVALYSIVLAHSCYQSIDSYLDRYFFTRLSSIGVVIFLFTCGYYFKTEKISSLIPKMLNKIVIPWFFCGTVLYLLGVLEGLSFSVMSYANYIIGNGSYLYYCTVYLVIRMLLCILPMGNTKVRTVLSCIFVVVNIVSLELTAFGVIPNSVSADRWFFEYLSPYMNIFNWIGFVGLGVLAKDYCIVEKLVKMKAPLKSVVTLLCFAVFAIGIFDSYFGYFGKLSMACEISMLVVAVLFTFMTPECSIMEHVVQIAKNSFSVYLIHYPFLSLFCHIDVLRQSAVAAFLRPAICIFVIVLALKLSESILSKLKLQKAIYVLVGVKPNTKFLPKND